MNIKGLNQARVRHSDSHLGILRMDCGEALVVCWGLCGALPPIFYIQYFPMFLQNSQILVSSHGLFQAPDMYKATQWDTVERVKWDSAGKVQSDISLLRLGIKQASCFNTQHARSSGAAKRKVQWDSRG